MRFADLIKTHDETHDRADKAAALEQAKANLAAATTANDRAKQARVDADQAIVDLLRSKGDHFIHEPDGSISIYRLAPDSSSGWGKVQPIPGGA